MKLFEINFIQYKKIDFSSELKLAFIRFKILPNTPKLQI
jgi:hypothetical protein